MRLDKWIAHATGLSRKEAKLAIRDERIRVNDAIITNAELGIKETDSVSMDNSELRLQGNIYIMLNKPAGYVCTHEDSHHPNIFSLIRNYKDLHAAGRLDADTTGLVLMTNDGQWSHQVTSPNKQCGKTYRVTLSKPLTRDQENILTVGILLDGETKPTRPAHIQHLGDNLIDLTIQEGKYHQVKRMFAAVDNKVIALHRSHIGHIELDSTLLPGEWRELTDMEQSSIHA